MLFWLIYVDLVIWNINKIDGLNRNIVLLAANSWRVSGNSQAPVLSRLKVVLDCEFGRTSPCFGHTYVNLGKWGSAFCPCLTGLTPFALISNISTWKLPHSWKHPFCVALLKRRSKWTKIKWTTCLLFKKHVMYQVTSDANDYQSHHLLLKIRVASPITTSTAPEHLTHSNPQR